jgi:hypothetical protein
MRVSEALLRAIRDTLGWNVIRIALVTAIPLAILWLAAGYYLWPWVMGVMEMLIGWVPFSVLKANGAFLIGGFVWMAVVLMSFGIVVALFNPLIMRLVRSERQTQFSILLLLLIAMGWTIFGLLNWDLVYSEVKQVLAWFPFQTLEAGVAALLAGMLFYNLFIASEAIVVLLMRRRFLHYIQQRDYPAAAPLEKEAQKSYVAKMVKDVLLFFLLLLLFFPLLFVPFFNLFVQVILWAWLIRDAYFRATASLYAPAEEQERLRRHEFVIWAIAFVTSLLNLVPVVNILTPFFALVAYLHWILLDLHSGEVA